MKPTEEAIILVGGQGTRLREVVSDVPKPLARVAGRPFLTWLLDALAARGMRRVVLATGYMADVVAQTIPAAWEGMEVVQSPETHPLGTGGAIGLASELLQGDAAHVLNGDSFLDYDPIALQAHSHAIGAPIAVALASVGDVGRYGAARLEQGKVTGFSEKGGSGPGWINAGCYHLDASALQAIGRHQHSFETAILAPAVARGEVAGLVFGGRFIDIGVPADYQSAQSLFVAE